MSKDYSYLELKGDDKNVYKYIAPYAMDRSIIRQFGGYPILTDDSYRWFFAFSGRNIVAWSALKVFKNKILFLNDFVEPSHRRKGIHTELIRKRIEWCKGNGYKIIEVDCLDTAINQYRNVGFKEVKTFSKWHKLKLEIQ